jgi:hypothetical protein
VERELRATRGGGSGRELRMHVSALIELASFKFVVVSDTRNEFALLPLCCRCSAAIRSWLISDPIASNASTHRCSTNERPIRRSSESAAAVGQRPRIRADRRRSASPGSGAELTAVDWHVLLAASIAPAVSEHISNGQRAQAAVDCYGRQRRRRWTSETRQALSRWGRRHGTIGNAALVVRRAVAQGRRGREGAVGGGL